MPVKNYQTKDMKAMTGYALGKLPYRNASKKLECKYGNLIMTFISRPILSGIHWGKYLSCVTHPLLYYTFECKTKSDFIQTTSQICYQIFEVLHQTTPQDTIKFVTYI